MATPTLLGLPPELRNRIFELTLVVPCAISIGQSVNRRLPDRTIAHDRAILQQPPLTRVNRQTRSEALAIFYGQNTFLIDHTNFDKRSDVIKAWSAFANETAQKHLGRLSYTFQMPRQCACAEPSTLEVVVDKAKTPQSAIKGPAARMCVCRAMGELRSHSVISPSSAVLEQSRGVISTAFVKVAFSLIPGLIEGLGMQTMIDMVLQGAPHGYPVCLDCGRVQWTVSQRPK
ncbi:hypothetical protein LTR56_003832 [Elasticomyces elasticus]|nr:hypothetical protein LTR22_013107 [Elasticomyces elasticus]KAK3654974.1 hypothetical protein LTR56_003832 [Elasticomyces elasticus]KAK4928694.1 hypothetical protein LTR49_004503 [Elasticomyces elasticus]KAK5766678.1 hypothetical protein LTS12_003297 [Elasticomyces elasticus]